MTDKIERMKVENRRCAAVGFSKAALSRSKCRVVPWRNSIEYDSDAQFKKRTANTQTPPVFTLATVPKTAKGAIQPPHLCAQFLAKFGETLKFKMLSIWNMFMLTTGGG